MVKAMYREDAESDTTMELDKLTRYDKVELPFIIQQKAQDAVRANSA
jgi:hypothetical protein